MTRQLARTARNCPDGTLPRAPFGGPRGPNSFQVITNQFPQCRSSLIGQVSILFSSGPVQTWRVNSNCNHCVANSRRIAPSWSGARARAGLVDAGMRICVRACLRACVRGYGYSWRAWVRSCVYVPGRSAWLQCVPAAGQWPMATLRRTHCRDCMCGNCDCAHRIGTFSPFASIFFGRCQPVWGPLAGRPKSVTMTAWLICCADGTNAGLRGRNPQYPELEPPPGGPILAVGSASRLSALS